MAKDKITERIIKVVKFNVKEQRSWFNNSNTSRKIKYWLTEYLDNLSNKELYLLIHQMADYIWNNTNIDKDKKYKEIKKIAKLHFKEHNSCLKYEEKNPKKVKYYLKEYLDKQTSSNIYSIISRMADYIYEYSELIEEEI